MNTKELKQYKKNLRLTPLQRDIIIGLMLGDGHLETLNNGRTYRLIVEQSEKLHADYLLHLYEVFKPFVLTPPKQKNTNLYFRTLTHPCLRFYGKLFYKETNLPDRKSIKVIPKYIHKYLNDRILAFWYMDDGAKKGKKRSGKRLHTEGLTYEEVQRLCAALNLLGIKTTINKQNRKDKTQYLLNITAEGDKILTERIKPYIHESMFYKL